nr:hypothetical protein CFP56_52129 [Quercus suber]
MGSFTSSSRILVNLGMEFDTFEGTMDLTTPDSSRQMVMIRHQRGSMRQSQRIHRQTHRFLAIGSDGCVSTCSIGSKTATTGNTSQYSSPPCISRSLDADPAYGIQLCVFFLLSFNHFRDHVQLAFSAISDTSGRPGFFLFSHRGYALRTRRGKFNDHLSKVFSAIRTYKHCKMNCAMSPLINNEFALAVTSTISVEENIDQTYITMYTILRKVKASTSSQREPQVQSPVNLYILDGSSIRFE